MMDLFLKGLKSTSKCFSKEKVFHIVMGNESCDLDSAVSALIYAYFLYWKNKIREENNSNESTDLRGAIFVPLFNIPKEDLLLKTEVMYFLEKVSINKDDLLCRDDVDFTNLVEKYKSLRLTIVDHHILGGKTSELIPYVSEILDHRPKDTSSWCYGETVKSNLQIVGSCATLVCSEIVNSGNGLKFFTDCKVGAQLLYGTILLDTVNFLPSADRARPLDFEMTQFLESILHIEDVVSARLKLFNELLHARTDYSSLNSFQLLKRDLKVINNFPIPGLPMLVKDYFEMEDCVKSLQSFCEINNFQIVVLMGLAIKADVVCRDIAVYSVINFDQQRKIVKVLCEASDPSLDLVRGACLIENCEYFIQNNTRASRKQIIPILKSNIELIDHIGYGA